MRLCTTTPLLIILASYATLCGCSTSAPERIDQAKFERLYRAARAVETLQLRDAELDYRLRELEIEVAVSEPLAANEPEKMMVSGFRSAQRNLTMARITRNLILLGDKQKKDADAEY